MPEPKTEIDDDAPLPRGPGDRIVSMVAASFMVLLAFAVMIDTPSWAPAEDRFLGKLLWRLVVTVVIGGFLYGWWRQKRSRSA